VLPLRPAPCHHGPGEDASLTPRTPGEIARHAPARHQHTREAPPLSRRHPPLRGLALLVLLPARLRWTSAPLRTWHHGVPRRSPTRVGEGRPAGRPSPAPPTSEGAVAHHRTQESCNAHVVNFPRADVRIVPPNANVATELACSHGAPRGMYMGTAGRKVTRQPWVMAQAVRRHQVAMDRPRFVDAARWLAAARAEESLPWLVMHPHRPYRDAPRVRTRRPQQSPMLQQTRPALRKALATKTDTDSLHAMRT
jgi:hypothetical protein